MQLPKSIAEIPNLSWSLGSISSEDKITAMKFEPIISEDEFRYLVMLFSIWDLNSDNDVCSEDFDSDIFWSLFIWVLSRNEFI